MKKRWLVLCCLVMLGCVSTAYALPYESYTYDSYQNVVPLPAPYVPGEQITGIGLGLSAFQQPTDMMITDDGEIYLSDTGNDRIIVFRMDGSEAEVIGGYDLNGSRTAFSKPQGVYVREGLLYVCDTGNGRVVALERRGAAWATHLVIERPDSLLLNETTAFAPLRVTVDAAGRVYIIGRNVLEGLMYFDDAGRFQGYFGTIKVQVSVADWIWRQLATQEQRKKQTLFIPTEFTGLDIDGEGFIFTTEVNASASEPLKRINPAGRDVIRNYTDLKLVGDLWHSDVGGVTGQTEFQDIVAWDNGCYTALDSKRSRLFTYNEEGTLLYVFGGAGTELGMLSKPTAVEVHEGAIYVLDQGRGVLLRYDPTSFGQAVNAAATAQHLGDDGTVAESWQQVLKLCAHYEPAYAGLGKAYLTAGDNDKAMEYLERGMDRRYYSVALRRYRAEQVKKWFVPVISALLVAAVAYTVIRRLHRRGRKHA